MPVTCLGMDHNPPETRKDPRDPDHVRRDLLIAAGAMATVGLTAAGWVAVSSLRPTADAYRPLYIDLRDIAPGETQKFPWRRHVVFVAHRTPEMIATAISGDAANLPYPEDDHDRALNQQWLVVIGECTLRGFELVDFAGAEPRTLGDHWLCPRCGSSYDLSGRLVRGPAPGNLRIPPHRLDGDDTLAIG